MISISFNYVKRDANIITILIQKNIIDKKTERI